METKREQLNNAVANLYTSVEEIKTLVKQSFADNDFEAVELYRDGLGATLWESGLVVKSRVKEMTDMLRVLENVIYVREKEKEKPTNDWREYAKVGNIIDAAKRLRAFVANPAFNEFDALMVAKAYVETPF